LLLTLGTVAPAPAADPLQAEGAKAKCKKAHKPGSKKGFCPATVYEVADGTQAADSKVRLSNAIVTAVAKSGETAWLGVKPGDAGYVGREYSGVELDLSNLSPTTLEVGDRVTVDGTVVGAPAGPRVVAASLSVGASGEEITPFEVGASS